MNSIKKIISLISNNKMDIYQIYILAILQGIFYLLVPLGIQAIITYTMVGQLSASLLLISILTVTAVLFIGLFQLWQLRISETIQQNLLVNIGLKFSNKIYLVNPNSFLKDFLPGKINQFFDILTLQKGLDKILLDLSFAFISIVFGLIILSAYNALFLVFTCFIAFLFYLMVRREGEKALESSLKESKYKYYFVDWLQELYQGVKTKDVKFDEEYIKNGTNQSLGQYLKEKNNVFAIMDKQYIHILIFKVVFTALLLFTGIWMVQTDKLNIGQFVAAEILVILIINSVEKLVVSLKTVYDVLTATEKIFQVLELAETKASETYVARSNFRDLHESLGKKIYAHNYQKKTKYLLQIILMIIIVILFLPWTQTISADGKISTLSPSERPQTIHSRISGRIEKWYVKEGDSVSMGDTIAYISEIKEDYFDPNLIQRTKEQVDSKESSISSYEKKINSIDSQIDAINNALLLKTQSTLNKVLQSRAKLVSDSAEYAASLNNYKIAEEQFKRFEDLLAKGIISKTDYENRKAKLQESAAKKISAENKWYNSKTDLINAEIELSSIKQEYNEKLMKSESEKFSALSMLFDAEGSLSKMQNQLSNYSIRNSFYYVTAPQDGYITKSFVQGVGEIVKEGASLLSIVPKINSLSVEFYIEPVDVPLVRKNMNVQLTFDGWPALVFSGWPGLSRGTYHAKVVAIDKVISDNGKFRVLATQGNEKWPAALQVGGGIQALGLLQNVPLGYEIWRKMNGFPPEFYKNQSPTKSETKNEKK